MPFVENGSISDRLDRFGAMAPNQVATLGAQLARSLQAAHDRGVVHRDLKPSNVLIDGAGAPLLADFGAAGRLEPSTPSETLALTVAYAAPEVLEGATPDARSDVYGLGLTLLAAATAPHPFGTGEPLATLIQQICDGEVPDPEALGVPKGLRVWRPAHGGVRGGAGDPRL